MLRKGFVFIYTEADHSHDIHNIIDCDKSSGQVIDLDNTIVINLIDNLSGRIIAVDNYSVLPWRFLVSVHLNSITVLILFPTEYFTIHMTRSTLFTLRTIYN